ncbi:hypothetical protein MBLNU459_g6060t1 [Dothideomycetes sp. NU459]
MTSTCNTIESSAEIVILDDANICLRVVLPNRHRDAKCIKMSISRTASADAIITELSTLTTSSHGLARVIETLVQALVIRRRRVEIATLSLIDPEEQVYPQRVLIESMNPNELLTTALHKPASLSHTHNFVATHLEDLIVQSSPETVALFEALCVRYEYCRVLACWWLCMAILVSAIVGIVVGMATNGIDRGIAIGTGVLAVLGAVQAGLIYLVK